jgi:hypothetical protein
MSAEVVVTEGCPATVNTTEEDPWNTSPHSIMASEDFSRVL